MLRCLLSEVPKGDRADRRSRYDLVMAELGEDYFSDDLILVYKIITKFYGLAGQPITYQQFQQLLGTQQGVDESVKIRLCSIFESLAEGSVDYAGFIHAKQLLKDLTRRDLLGQCIYDSGDILINGMKEGRKILYGYEDARDRIQETVSKIEAMHMGAMPDGNINEESVQILQEYVNRKSKSNRQYPTGLVPVDEKTGGLQPGELWFIAGYTAEGKTSLVVNIAYNLVYNSGLNVAYGTNETLRRQVRLKLVSRHSCHPKFGGSILPYEKLKMGELSPEQEQLLQAVVQDMATCKDYGRLELFQLPFRASIGYVETKLSRYNQRTSLDVAVIDELRLLSSGLRRASPREELDDIIRGSKQLAVSFSGGRGISLVCPYQVSRDAWREALDTGTYTKACMSNTSEAERAADGIVTILRTEQGGSVGQLVKYRDAGEDENVKFAYEVRAEACLFQAARQTTNSDWFKI